MERPDDEVRSEGSSELVDQLRQGMEHRTEIGIALGVIMAQLDVSREQAQAYLWRVSQDTNRKVYDLAREVVATRRVPS
jgi:AmiR/NasT family two-component response regulator